MTESLVHLMSDDLLDACESAPQGVGLVVTPVVADVTCEACKRLTQYIRPAELEMTVEQRRAASIAEIKASFPGIDRGLVSDSWLGRALAKADGQ